MAAVTATGSPTGQEKSQIATETQGDRKASRTIVGAIFGSVVTADIATQPSWGQSILRFIFHGVSLTCGAALRVVLRRVGHQTIDNALSETSHIIWPIYPLAIAGCALARGPIAEIGRFAASFFGGWMLGEEYHAEMIEYFRPDSLCNQPRAEG